MNTDKSLKIAIFGLSLRALNELKEQVRHIIPIDITIHWTNISEPDLNALLINDHFFDSASIQNLIHTNQPQYLRLITQEGTHSSIQDDILYLPVVDPQPLRTWLFDHVILQVMTASTSHAPRRPATSAHSSATISKHSPSNTVPNKSPQSVSLSREDIKIKLKLFQDLLNPQNGKIRIFDQQGQLAIVDMRNEVATLDPSRQQQISNLSLNFTYATMNDTVKLRHASVSQVYVWLWNLLWASPEFNGLSPEQGFYRLKYWPQPVKGPDRRDILRMAACFSQGASIEFVASHLNLPLVKVRQFIAAGLATYYMESISAEKVGFNAQKLKNDPLQNQSSVRKFFGGLRRRLGL